MRCLWKLGHPLMMSLVMLLSACGGESKTDSESIKAVTILGGLTGQPRANLERALAPFKEETGIEIIYEGTEAFSVVLSLRVESGNPPDIAIFPQPASMADFAEDGQLVPMTAFIEEATLNAAYPESWLDLGSWNDTVYGLWYRASIKSLVWYSPEVFQANGYEIPQTWEDLIALSDQMMAQGTTPWCIGLDSGAATGWAGTDWIEDIMLRTVGPDGYDQWVAHQIPFIDDRVKAAFELFGQVALNPNYVVGGSVGTISTSFRDSPQGLFSDPPSCFLHRQANFIANFFPDNIVLGEDVDFFLFPEIDQQFGSPLLVAGDIFAMFNDTPEARALMTYLASPTPHEIWAEQGGFLSPHQQVNPAVYPNAVTQKQIALLTGADTIRFDASDLMPEPVGVGSFWAGVVDYVAGTPVDEVLEEIEASWPE